MRVILATGDEGLNRALAGAGAIEVVAEVHYREALSGEQVARTGAGVAVVSTRLPGRTPLARAVLPLRLAGIRVVLVGPPLPRAEAEELVLLGVYDLLTGEQPVARMVEALERPWTLGQALAVVREGDDNPKPGQKERVLQLLRRIGGQQEQKEGGRRAGGHPVSAGGETRTGAEAPPVESGSGSEEKPEAKVERRPVVAVWSPLAAGKTFVAVELAATLGAEGVPVLLVDADAAGRGLAGRVCLPEQGGSEYPVWENVWVSCTDLSSLRAVLDTGEPADAWRVVDLPAGGGEAALDAADVVVYVADPDWGRSRKLRQEYRRLVSGDRKPLLAVVNRWVESERAKPEDVLGMAPPAVFPMSVAAYTAMLTGKPAQDLDPVVRAAAHELALAVAGCLGRLERSTC